MQENPPRASSSDPLPVEDVLLALCSRQFWIAATQSIAFNYSATFTRAAAYSDSMDIGDMLSRLDDGCVLLDPWPHLLCVAPAVAL